MRRFLLPLFLLLLPASALAAPLSVFSTGRTVLVATSSPANSYALGGSVAVSGATLGDLTALGGSVVAAAPVKGDALLAGGSVEAQAPIGGDLRALAGTVSVVAPVTGDIAAVAGSASIAARARGSVFIVAGSANILGGADGSVAVYANTVRLSGEYAHDVRIVAGSGVSIAPGTRIKGVLSYDAPEAAAIPADAEIGAISYAGSSAGASAGKALAFVGVGVFLFARVLGALILAGLVAGLFPRLAEALAARAFLNRPRGLLLTTLLGFAALAATPVLLVILSLTFVGLGLALFLLLAYGMLALLSFAYAGILLGAALARRFGNRTELYWRDGALGMLVLSFAWLVPFLGPLAVALLVFFCAGALLTLFFHFAFPHEGSDRA